MSHLHTDHLPAIDRGHAARGLLARLRTAQNGEGVISAAIVVLIMAILGAAMWVAFDGVFTDAVEQTEENVNQIGG